MKRYCVVLNDTEQDNTLVEFYWADNHDHAEEQAKDSNPTYIVPVAVVRDPQCGCRHGSS